MVPEPRLAVDSHHRRVAPDKRILGILPRLIGDQHRVPHRVWSVHFQPHAPAGRDQTLVEEELLSRANIDGNVALLARVGPGGEQATEEDHRDWKGATQLRARHEAPFEPNLVMT